MDGASFGTSFAQVFLMHYPMAVILPPKIYHYEPKIFGFKIAGKRGSKYFDPPRGNVRYIEDSVQALEIQDVRSQPSANITVDFNKKLALNQVPVAAKTATPVAQNDAEDDEAAPAGNNDNRAKKNRKKNKQK